ncbi:MAG TPA: CbiX/SirB N-terminal domain-containing protein [Casimicrobiaceae bacterium]
MESDARITSPAPSAAHRTRGVLLVAHGSRDPAWAAPFEALRARIAAQHINVELAYLELMKPDVESAVAALAARGCTHATVVPLFLGQGGHVRDDLPRRVAAAMQASPSIALALVPPIGENADVLDAIAAACIALHGSR